MSTLALLRLPSSGYDAIRSLMLDQEAAREFDRLRAHLGLATAPEPQLVDDRYRLERVLGRGAMGVVHLAHDQRLDRRVALKLVRSRADVDLERLHLRLDREARALARVEHPNLVAIYDVGRHEGQAFFTMQYVPGTTLRDWRDEREPSAEEIVDAYLQAARGLAAAHDAQVVHRDFKPDNVLVSDTGLVQVADFGIAAALHLDTETAAGTEGADLLHEVGSTQPSDDGRLTRTGAFVGTMAYAAPEQLRGEPADARSDQFALCVALWEALDGRRPFEGRNRSTLEHAIEDGPRGGERLPAWLLPLLRRGLSPRPEGRFSSVDALITAIERGRTRRRRTLLSTAAVLGIGLATAAGWSISTAARRAQLQTCDDYVAEVDTTWGAEQEAALPEGSASRYAATTLDELVGDWKHSARELCRDDLAPSPDDEARRCHEAWRQTLQRTVTLLVDQGDARTLERAPDLLDRLVPPDGDYCAFRPAPAVDPVVWTLAESAREAAILGDAERARQQADAALTRAHTMGSDAVSPHLAEAHAAHAEVMARGGEVAGAFPAFEVAERHAIGTGYQLRLWWLRLLWAKVVALGEEPGAGERAAEHLRRAEPLIFALGQSDHTLLRAELAEARGMVERALGNHREAIEQHQAAAAGFEALGRPLMVARALLGAGTSFQMSGETDGARRAYERAEAIYAELDVPPVYRNRVRNRLNLGIIAYEGADAAGLPHLQFVTEHGTEEERLTALALAIGLADGSTDSATTISLADRGLDELRTQTSPSPRAAHDLVLAAGVALGYIDDPRGEPLLKDALQRARTLPPEVQALTHRTYAEWLRDMGRCDDARSWASSSVSSGPPPPWAEQLLRAPCPPEIPDDPKETTR